MNNIRRFEYKDQLFSIIYIIYALLSVIYWSQLTAVYSQFEKVYLGYQLVCLPILVILYFWTKPTSKSFLLYIVLISLALYCTYVVKDTFFMMFIFFFFAAKGIDYKKLMQKDIVVKITIFLLILFLYKIGYLNNLGVISRATGEIRQTLGFNYPTYVMYMIMLISIEWIIIRGKHISYIEIVIIILIGNYFGNITDARGEKLTLFFICFGIFWVKLCESKLSEFFEQKGIKTLLILTPEIACLISYFFIMFLHPSNQWYSIINKFFSWRLNIIQMYYQDYGVKLLPSHITLNYIGDDGKWIQVIDNCYLYLGIKLGLLSLIVYLIIFSFLIYSAIKYKNNIMIIIMLSFVLLNIVEYVALAPSIAIYCITWCTMNNSPSIEDKFRLNRKTKYGNINNSSNL